jgi:hypothetical protein
MPIHKLRTIFDVDQIVDRYSLQGVATPLHGPKRLWTWHDFANWLFVRTNTVSAVELQRYVDEFDDLFPIDPAEAEARKVVIRINAEDVMSGVQVYEKQAHGLMWIIRELRASQRGSRVLGVIAEMATSLSVMETFERTLERLSDGDMQPLQDVLIAINQLGKFDPSTKYRPGDDSHTDFYIRLDILRLDETLANESLWRDDDNMFWPVEVSALVAAAAIYVAEMARQKNSASVH